MMNLTEAKEIIGRYGLSPNKRLGQNFLVSGDMRDKMIDMIGVATDDRVLEIGPGLGALTERLVPAAESVTAVEVDSGLSRVLADRFGAEASFRLIHSDFLKLDLADTFTKVVSNLPYYCASEILFHVARFSAPHVYVLLQKEMAERIVAVPGSKTYGALTVTLGFYYEPKVLFRVSKESFYPRPEVTSSFVRLVRKSRLPVDGGEIELFHLVVKSAFWGRRKTMLKALSESPHLETGREIAARMLEHAGINSGVRGEDLGLESFVALVRAYRAVMAER
ncbi:MAG TPA: 16S rRNA (adenine(1518)-N(6)/adenine(1519)-N(6))-dimethyltransferase RsmA [Spirochaetota bacterium]|nr:16S rRNA (adenine(1518)-N(6)/adenine(1519)-N(6))-dimethyltransferase RsmA [Spirochaetota bacterium]HPG49517.1 16S rRNA (adenine(1518)-N(6)/adenine(1519)-N(6))-dimethyltransferase RsmA [Spirochaetota bacterium]HPN12662.1 16S rRNA (adenine(1518)-N(6)/adenine(1519)-N(6))-dimethyltransferase RsmA [Spirochaetota bacterium]